MNADVRQQPANWYTCETCGGTGKAPGREPTAPKSPSGAEEMREPLVKSIERVLDDNSAWISAPNKKVVREIAWAAAIAAQDMAKEMVASGSDLERKLIEALEPFIDCDEKFERWPDYWPVDEHGYCESCLGHGRTRRSFPKLKDHDPDCKLRSAYELLAAIRQLQEG